MRFVSIAMAIGALSTNIPHAMAQTPIVFDQAPCPLKSGYCSVLHAKTTDYVIRDFQFVAPKAGKAVVTFNGSMTCIANAAPLGFEVTTQIVPAGATAVPTGPSSTRLGESFPVASVTGVNLASTRVFNYRRPGSYKVAFAMRKIGLESTTSCVVTSAAFTVLYLPVK